MAHTGRVVEQVLPGGFVNRVVRVGDTVRRNPGHRAEFVHRLLRHLEQRKWAGAPRLLGVDEHGREVLTFIDGFVAWRSPTDRVCTTEGVEAVARLVRQFHDLTAGTSLAGDEEVVATTTCRPRTPSTGTVAVACSRSLSWTGTSPRRAPASTTWRTCAGST